MARTLNTGAVDTLDGTPVVIPAPPAAPAATAPADQTYAAPASAPAAPAAPTNAAPATPAAPSDADFEARVNAAVDTRLAAMPPRAPNPTHAEVTRPELPYRFDGSRGEHGFLGDIIAAKYGSSDASTRLNEFLTDAFASITTGNVASHNPVPTRPELYVEALHYGRPLWNLVTTGTLEDITAFIIPKFGSSAGLVGPHTQGVEPTEGSFTATSQTITPTAMSGKAILNREVVDQGGNPQVDQIIWNEMLAGYFDSLEEAIAAALATSTATEINIGAGTDDAAKIKLLNAALSRLQFVKGGDRFQAFAADPTLYGLVASATDSTGRPLFPTFGPTNADGTKRPSLESVQLGSRSITPAWALAVDEDASGDPSEASYLFVPGSVLAWASAPRRIDIEYKVATVEVGIWGYKATGVTRTTDIIPVDATTSDTAD